MPEAIGAGFSVLAVDDEPNIVSALRRTLRSRGFTVHTALGGAEGLELLEKQPVDAIISDMRMPEMTGAQFLQAARVKLPDAVRILLTGYADITSTIEAVNHGEIFRYLSKPWEDDVLLSVLNDGLERKRLARERDQLLALTKEQNEQLQRHAEELEEKVRERTQDLQRANERIGADFKGTVKMLSTILEQRPGLTDGCARRVAEHVRALGPRVGLVGEELQDTIYAALLEDLGKLTFPEKWLTTPLHVLGSRDRDEFMKHPLHGEGYLMSLESLRGAGRILRGLYERWDGKGPFEQKGEQIPLGSRVLRAASEYERLRSGSIESRQFSHQDACNWLRNGSETRFDPKVAAALIAQLNDETGKANTHVLGVAALKPGMVLAQDLTAGVGVLLLSKDHRLDEAMIRRLDGFQRRIGQDLQVTVYRSIS